MKAHQKTTKIDAAAVEDYINKIIRDAGRIANDLPQSADRLRLTDAIEVFRLARQTFQLAIEMIVPFEAN
jgi:hypothetical protein